VKRPALGSVILSLIPFAAICLLVELWDRIYPTAFGIPFNFLWLTCWLLLTPLCMWGVYRLEAPRRSDPTNVKKGEIR